METDLFKLTKFLDSHSIMPSVVENVLRIDWTKVSEESADFVLSRLKTLVDFDHEQAKFEQICREHGWTEDQIALTRFAEKKPKVKESGHA